MGRPRKHEQYVQAVEAATGEIDGETFVVSPRTTILASDHPIVKAYPHFFRPLEPTRRRPDVEMTTAAPGEKRGEQ